MKLTARLIKIDRVEKCCLFAETSRDTNLIYLQYLYDHISLIRIATLSKSLPIRFIPSYLLSEL